MHKRVNVLAGEFVVTTTPTIISTILGSCVAVCLWDKVNLNAGLNHFLLPGDPEKDTSHQNRGISSTTMMIKALISRDSKIDNLEAMVFGGSNSIVFQNDVYQVGKRNVEAALAVLHDFNIKVVDKHIGGKQGRKIRFDTQSGVTQVSMIRQINDLDLIENKELNRPRTQSLVFVS